MATEPLSASSMPATTRTSVDLPAPLRPISPTRAPCGIVALARGWGAGVQLLEDVNFDLLSSLVFESAIGALLDLWGAIVGEERGPLGDADYRRHLARVLTYMFQAATAVLGELIPEEE